MSDISPSGPGITTTDHTATDSADLSPSVGTADPTEPAHSGSEFENDRSPIAPTRASATWTAVVGAVIVLVALIIFIAQNTQKSRVNFLWFHGEAPTSVVLLIAACAGAIVVIGVGVVRILQLRRVARRTSVPPR